MNSDEKTDYLIGQANTLNTFCIALIRSHPDSSALQDAFDKSREMALAKDVQTTVSEATLTGAREQADRISSALEIAVKHRGNRNKGPSDS